MTINTPFRTALVAAAIVLCGAVLTACDKEQMNQAKADANRTASKVSQDVKQATNEMKQDIKNAADKAQPVLGDAAITASIQTDYLKDPDLSVLKIDVDTRDGVVTLNGMAGTPDSRVRAEKLAASIKGVKEVRKLLTVKQG